MAVLVTGVAGFIGAAVAERLLARGEAVIGIDDFNDYYDPAVKRARIARVVAQGGDLRVLDENFAAWERPETTLGGRDIDRIVHLGAQAGVRNRKSVVSGKSVSVRVDFGGRRYRKKKKNQKH